ncbi:MAG: hypothetical protein KGJ03_02335 [Betaproteobacteria bacterium]|nr:hypothetical protein [Betaproteobacteria bacterium]MBU6512177.1 hypothetical protein [Betaproteobacteria bacterium]MDE1954536.1 hypothetical protein [Betaproteobacteria bacterium]MDE2151915.1 hypothetical protein [Betaproteobacteria bacterium]
MRTHHRHLFRLFLGACLLAPWGCAALASPLPAAAAQPSSEASRPDPSLPPQGLEGFGVPPPDPTAAPAAPVTPASALQFMKRDMRHYFDRAADPNTHRVSKEGAQRSGWGYAAEHFEAMDANHDGELSFDEVWSYVLAHIPKD